MPVLLSMVSALVMIGGLDGLRELMSACLLFDNITTDQFSCKKVCVHIHVYVSIVIVQLILEEPVATMVTIIL